MIDQERVAIMTKLAITEQREGRELMRLCSYKRLDYILTEVFRAFVAGTVCYVLAMVLWFCYLWDNLNAFTAGLDYLQFFRSIGVYYLVALFIYMGLCALVAYFRHRQSAARRKRYLNLLRRLRVFYNAEEMPESRRESKKRKATR